MRSGKSPEEACREAVRRIVKRDPAKMKGQMIGKENTGIQVGFFALSRSGEIGAFSIHEGFTYSVTNAQYPKGKVFRAKSWF
jgi:N4-(beta-N-acetylglucosaminyl)-L-asparaginase